MLTFALAIGANGAIFSTVHTVLLRPIPSEAPERLAVVWQTDQGGQAVIELTHRHLREWTGAGTTFSRAAVMGSHNWSAVLQGRGEPSRLWFSGATTLDTVVGRDEAPWRLTMWMFVLFAVLAFALAGLGLFSLVAIDVARRGREFAIRMARGATRPAILGSVRARAAWRVSAGILLGMAAAVATSRAMRGLLFSVAPDDAATYGAVLLIVAAAVSLAAYLPARRVARVDPQMLLRRP